MAHHRTGDYCFSEKPRGLPGPEKTCRYERAEDGTLCLTRAFGRDVSGKERYSFDFDAPAAPAQDDELHPICGNFLEEVTLPDSLRVIGSCTFYNCRRLRRLTAGTGELTMGSDVFLNCFALEDLIIRATPEQATGLFALVGSIAEAVRALFWPVGEAAPRAGRVVSRLLGGHRGDARPHPAPHLFGAGLPLPAVLPRK